jgi:hypothetical protein
MKRIYTILMILSIALTLLNNVVFSQIKFGLRGGLNLANVSEDLGGTETVDFEGTPIQINLNQTNRTTFGIGGVVEYWVTPIFALQVNALYNQKGVGIDGNINETLEEQGIPFSLKVTAEETIKLSYLSFPVLAKVAFGENIKPYLIAGPEIGILLSGKDYAKATSEAEAMGMKIGPITEEQDTDIKDQLESLDFAINFGAGVLIPLGVVEIFVDAQYSLGLTKINKEDFSYRGDLKNRVFIINAGMLFSSL